MAVNEIAAGTHRSPSHDGPDVISVGTEAAVFEALASQTARDILAALGYRPAPVSVVAATVDASIQTVTYHLDRLERAGLVVRVGSRFSSKGRVMDVFAPATEAFVVTVDDGERSNLDAVAIERIALGPTGRVAHSGQAVDGDGDLVPLGDQDPGRREGGQPSPKPPAIRRFLEV